MNQLIALVSLIVISVGLQLGNYWFTFGLWPRSWAAFTGFAIAGMIVGAAMGRVMRDE